MDPQYSAPLDLGGFHERLLWHICFGTKLPPSPIKEVSLYVPEALFSSVLLHTVAPLMPLLTLAHLSLFCPFVSPLHIVPRAVSVWTKPCMGDFIEL